MIKRFRYTALVRRLASVAASRRTVAALPMSGMRDRGAYLARVRSGGEPGPEEEVQGELDEDDHGHGGDVAPLAELVLELPLLAEHVLQVPLQGAQAGVGLLQGALQGGQGRGQGLRGAATAAHQRAPAGR